MEENNCDTEIPVRTKHGELFNPVDVSVICVDGAFLSLNADFIGECFGAERGSFSPFPCSCFRFLGLIDFDVLLR